MAKHMAKHVAEHVAEHMAKHVAKHEAEDVVEKHMVAKHVDIAKHEAEVDAVADKWYKAVAVQDMKGKQDKVGKEDKGHMVWAKAEMVAFYISAVDMMLDESVMVQNYNYHNILHSILAYTCHY
jgi:hypothetical protein